MRYKMDYKQLLDKAFTQLPNLSVEQSDFKIPEADSLVQGSKTLVKNIEQIASRARRDKSEIIGYLTRELAAPISMNGQVMEINAKVNSASLNEKIKKFFTTYVICKECHKPDTNITGRDRGYVTISCEACGARYTVKSY
jgi:translation initiation factor 2 subunit 2